MHFARAFIPYKEAKAKFFTIARISSIRKN